MQFTISYAPTSGCELKLHNILQLVTSCDYLLSILPTYNKENDWIISIRNPKEEDNDNCNVH
jgi:hypothetical protein